MAKKIYTATALAATASLIVSAVVPPTALADPVDVRGGTCSDVELIIAGSESGEDSADDMLRRIADRVQRDGGSVGAYYADGEDAAADVTERLGHLSDECDSPQVAFLGAEEGVDVLTDLAGEIAGGDGPIDESSLLTTVVMDASAPSGASTSGNSTRNAGSTSASGGTPNRANRPEFEDSEITSIPAAPEQPQTNTLIPGLPLPGGGAPAEPTPASPGADSTATLPSTSGTQSTLPSTSGTTSALPGVGDMANVASGVGDLAGTAGLGTTGGGGGLLGAFTGLSGMPEMVSPGLGGTQPGGVGSPGGLRKVQSSGLVESAATVAMGDLGHAPDTVVRSLSAAVGLGQVVMSINPMRVASLGTNAAAMAAEPNPMSAYVMAVDALAITSSVATAWESNPNLPQLMEFLDLIDPAHPLGQRVLAMMPEQLNEDQIKALGIGVTLSRKVLELGPSRILSLSSQLADQTIRPNPLALPQTIMESLTLATDLGMLLADPEVHQAGLTLTQLDPNQLLAIGDSAESSDSSSSTSTGGSTSTSTPRSSAPSAGGSSSRSTTETSSPSTTQRPSSSSDVEFEQVADRDGVTVVRASGSEGEDAAVEHLLDKIN